MHQDSPLGPTSAVYCLAKDDTAYQWLLPFCRPQALELTGFTTIADLAVSLAARPCAALLIFADACPQPGGFGALIDYLAHRLDDRPRFIGIAAKDDLKLRLDAARAGGVGFFVMPTDGDVIAAAIKQLAQREPTQPKRVLVVDDVAVEAMVSAQVLRKAGFEVRELTDELKIIETIRDFHPDLILMDLNMPNATGAELTAIIRDHDDGLLTPIVFLSGERDAAIQRQTLRLGADEFLTKPLDPELLVETVRSRIQRSQSIQQRLSRGVQNDEATGLMTRRGFLRALDGALHTPTLRRAGNGVLFIAINNAEPILKKAGIGGEDMLLAHVGAVLREQLSQDDIAARFGKFSFTLLAHCADDAALTAFAVRLRHALSDHVVALGRTELRINASIGISSFAGATSDAITHISHSESACWSARDQASNGIHLYQDASAVANLQDGTTDACARIEQLINTAGLELVFAPLMNLQQQAPEPRYRVCVRIAGTALDAFRADAGLRRTVSADGTLHLTAVRSVTRPSLIARIDLWTLGTALQTLADQRTTAKPCRLFVPQSMSTLRLKQWLNWTSDRLTALQPSSDRLVLLIDNADLLSSLATANVAFPALAELRIGICVTDFTPQPASLSLLHDFDIDYVVPRGSLVAEPAQRGILSQLISNAHAQRTGVIADGVGDAETVSRLWDVGVDLIIGPFVQPPSAEMNFDFDAV